MNAKLMTYNLQANRANARFNHRNGVKRWANARTRHHLVKLDLGRGYVTIDERYNWRRFPID